MSNETKRDVFKVAMNHAAKSGWVDYSEMMNRYDTALPDNLPVIPEAVGDAIKIHREYAHSLLDIFGALSIYGVSRAEPAQEYNAWIVHHPDTFALAWVLGLWRVDETGEIVKLEAEVRDEDD
ncbi:hypothetical protein [Lacticaseibacillus salsurivasis]|uniref:hypothetical protein n=1 Tax=Lacticaseibacillus salsurivasis TaxID=3081441 RepID=UPI0030C69A37